LAEVRDPDMCKAPLRPPPAGESGTGTPHMAPIVHEHPRPPEPAARYPVQCPTEPADVDSLFAEPAAPVEIKTPLSPAFTDAANRIKRPAAPPATLSPEMRQSYLAGLGTIRECIDCGCLVAGGPTRCKGCAFLVDAAPVASCPGTEIPGGLMWSAEKVTPVARVEVGPAEYDCQGRDDMPYYEAVNAIARRVRTLEEQHNANIDRWAQSSPQIIGLAMTHLERRIKDLENQLIALGETRGKEEK